jgi:DNA-binding MarR family transcriptional regulator
MTDEPRGHTDRADGAALGARLRRLSERIDRELAALYAARGEAIEQRWFGTLDLLDKFGPLSVGELAEAMGITHVSVSQTRQSLQDAGLVALEGDPNDRRRRLLQLTPAGRALVDRLRPLWDALSSSARELDAEAGGVVAVLDRLEAALDRASVAARAEPWLKGERS